MKIFENHLLKYFLCAILPLASPCYPYYPCYLLIQLFISLPGRKYRAPHSMVDQTILTMMGDPRYTPPCNTIHTTSHTILYYTILLYKLKYWENIQYIHKHGYSSVTFSHFTSKLWWYFTYMTIILALLVASFDGDKKYFYRNTLLLY